MATKRTSKKWEFKAQFRRHAFGWRSQPAIKRVKAEEHCGLCDSPFAIARRLAGGSGCIEQSLADGRSRVLRISRHHYSSDSRYGRMTLATRQIFAKRRSSSMSARRSRQHWRSTSQSARGLQERPVSRFAWPRAKQSTSLIQGACVAESTRFAAATDPCG